MEIPLPLDHPELLTLLIMHGADINAQDKIGYTLLHRIKVAEQTAKIMHHDEDERKYYELLRQLLIKNEGANTDLRNTHGQTASEYVSPPSYL